MRDGIQVIHQPILDGFRKNDDVWWSEVYLYNTEDAKNEKNEIDSTAAFGKLLKRLFPGCYENRSHDLFVLVSYFNFLYE